MFGKLVGRGEHRQKSFRDSRVGGFVSIEDLAKQPKTPLAGKAGKKKVPFLSLGRQTTAPKAQSDDDGSDIVAPDVSLFSNIPATPSHAPSDFTHSASRSISRPPSRPASVSRPASPMRPKTADPAIERRRSKTMPIAQAPLLTLDWADKPLPLSIDFDHARKRSSSSIHLRMASIDNASAGASLPRPKTSHSTDSRASIHGRKRSISGASKTCRPTYSLTPAISPEQSRRPSLSGSDIRRLSQAALAKVPSNSSPNGRQRSNSRTSVQSPPPDRPAPQPSPSQSILHEVEGTLSATIRELQDLQGSWDQFDAPRPARTDSLLYQVNSSPEVPRSAPALQEQFANRSYSHDALMTPPPSMTFSGPSSPPSMPPTPRSDSRNEVPSLARAQSIQIAYEKQKAAMHKLSVENDTLKKQLQFARERLAEIGELNTEKETVEVALREARSNFEVTLNQLRSAKSTIEASELNTTHLNRRLEEANVQKVDLMEENGELHMRVQTMQKEMERMKQEMVQLRRRPTSAALGESQRRLALAEDENKLLSEQAAAAKGRADLPAVVADLTFKLDDIKRTIVEKDKYIEELESQTQSLSQEMEQLRDEKARLHESKTIVQVSKADRKRLAQLERQVIEIEKERCLAQMESERHMQLLKEQLRRTATDVHKSEHPASALIERKLPLEDAVEEVRSKAARRLAQALKGTDTPDSEDQDPDAEKDATITALQREIDYHVKDIILYKLDVKGYKKDLKRAQAKIAELKETTTAMAEHHAQEMAELKELVRRVREEQRKELEWDGQEVPQLVAGGASAGQLSDSEGPVTPGSGVVLAVPVMHIVQAWSPGSGQRGSGGKAGAVAQI